MINNDKSTQYQYGNQEDMFQKIFQASPDGYIISRILDGKILQVNRSAEVIFGYSTEEMLGKTSVELGLFADLKDREKATGILKEKGFVRDFNLYIFRKSGERRFISLAVEMVDLNGEQCMLTSVRDITERKQIEEENQRLLNAVQEEKERLSSLLRSINDEIWFADVTKNVTLVNPAVLHEFGSEVPMQGDIGKIASSLEVYRPDSSLRPAGEAPLLRALQGEVIKDQEEIIRTPASGKLRHRQVSAAPVRDAQGKIIGSVSVVRDITEMKKFQEERERLLQKVEIHALQLQEVNQRLSTANEELAVSNEELRVTTEELQNEIMDHKKSEEALKLREAQLDAFFANSPVYISLFDENWCYINMDEHTASLVRQTREELKGKCLEDLVGEQFAKYRESMQYTVETGVPLTTEQSNPQPSSQGEMLYWITSQFRVPLGNGKWGLGQISTEITDIKRAEAKLRESEERFHTLADNISQLAWMADQDGSIFWYNKRWYDYTGTTFEEMQGWGWKKVHHPDHIEHVMQNWTNAIKRGEAWEDTFPLRSKEGEYRWFLSRALPIRLDNDKILRWFGTNTDITDRKIAEESEKRAKHQYELLFNSIHEGFAHYKAVYDETGRLDDILVFEINPSGAVLSGVSREEQIGKRWKEVWSGIEDFLFDNYRQVDQTGETLTFEHLSAVTNRWYTTNIYKIADGEFAVTFFDINDRKIAEINLNKTLIELERSNKDLERFAFAASHDLQEPIRMMGSYAHLLMKRYKGNLSPQADRYLKFMFEGALRLQLLIRDLLNYSRLRADKMDFTKIDLNTILTSVLDDLKKPIIETNAEISFGEMPEIVANRNQIKQLFSNLLSNAIRFRKKDAAPEINIFAEDKGKEWLFVVEDNGIGIEAEFSKLIFDVFQRLNDREEYPGVGIGLAICKRIIERHEGSIWVESEPGKGSRFCFIIPKKESKALK